MEKINSEGTTPKRKYDMLRFIYGLVIENGPMREGEIVRIVSNEYEWREFSRWQMRVCILKKLDFLCNVGLLDMDVRRTSLNGVSRLERYYTPGEYAIGDFPRIVLRCKLKALFYGGKLGEGFSYPLFRFERMFFDGYSGFDEEDMIVVKYDGFDARECEKYMVEVVSNELKRRLECLSNKR